MGVSDAPLKRPQPISCPFRTRRYVCGVVDLTSRRSHRTIASAFAAASGRSRALDDPPDAVGGLEPGDERLSQFVDLLFGHARDEHVASSRARPCDIGQAFADDGPRGRVRLTVGDWRQAVVEYMELYTPDTFALANPDSAAEARQLQAVSARVGPGRRRSACSRAHSRSSQDAPAFAPPDNRVSHWRGRSRNSARPAPKSLEK